MSSPAPANSSASAASAPSKTLLSPAPTHLQRASWRPRSVALIVLIWFILHIGGLFSPGLLDDVDSVYIEIAREMLQRHDFVTPYIDGIRFFDKPPLMYWLAAGSMHLFGVHDWAARLPLALLTLALFLATYALGLRLFAAISPAHARDRGALYASLALATSIGPYLYTRFFIPDIVVTLWLTLSVHLFLVATARARTAVLLSSRNAAEGSASLPPTPSTATPSSLAPMLGFSATCALSLLTKGFIGLVFPLGFALFYLALNRDLALLRRLHLVASTALFLVLALPWHILVALRNPAIPLPPGLGLPARGGWAWFYLYNEHIARFLSRRIPHDYGQVPIPLFWLLAVLWLLPWAAFLPGAIRLRFRELRGLAATGGPHCHEAAVSLTLWAVLVLGFFTLSARQEYYSLPALPALALLAGGLLARADRNHSADDHAATRSILLWTRFLLLPLFSVIAIAALAFALTAKPAAPGTDIATLLAHAKDNTAYNLSLSHLSDLTGAAMGLFRGPLLLTAIAALTLGPAAWLVRRSGATFAANLTLATGATLLLLSMHAGLAIFYPTLGSKGLAEAVLRYQSHRPAAEDCHLHPVPSSDLLSTAGRPCPADLLLIDGELTSGSTLLFYTGEPVHLVDGRVNGPWYGSFWPDSPAIFETNNSLHQLWSSPRRLFLLTDHPVQRIRDLAPFGPVSVLAAAGGKAILMNHP